MRFEALIVAHGSPSDPEPQERFMRRIAERVGARCGARVVGATLAKPGALEAAVSGMEFPLVFPHFMTDGWFVSTYLQKRLMVAGLAEWKTLTPLGLDALLPRLVERRLSDELAAGSLALGETTLVVAAHGSPSNPRPAEVTFHFSEMLRQSMPFADVRVGFVDETPTLQEAASVEGPAILLPFFAARAGHVLSDLPEALRAASFGGVVLPPIGTWDEVPFLISHALAATSS